MTTQAKTGGVRPQAKGRQEPPALAGEPTAWCLGRGTALRLGPPTLCQHRWALGISPAAGGGEPQERGLHWALELGTKERAVPPPRLSSVAVRPTACGRTGESVWRAHHHS